MKAQFYCLVLFFIMINPIHNAAFNLSQINKRGEIMDLALCNKDTVLDFNFSPLTTISCTNTGCITSSPQLSSVKFLDVAGSQQTYKLLNAGTSIYSLTSPVSRTQEKGLIRLKFESSSGRVLYVGIPFSNMINPPSSIKPYELDMSKVDDSSFSLIKSVTDFTSTPMSAFNFLNKRDYGHFYHLADSAFAPTETSLLSYFVLSNSTISLTNLPSSAYNFLPSSINSNAYTLTGDKLCWGSINQGIFQTHLRESYPLWTAWFGILFYWVYVLLTDSNEMNCYDKKFENNKWTCWGFYSLHFLGHEDYFTKLSRTTLMLNTFSWQGCILAILYYNFTPGQGPIMILWAALIAVGSSIPFNYVIGGIFMSKIYELTLHKYDTIKQMKGVFNKKDGKMQALQKSVDDTEQTLYGYYYWYYVIAFCFFLAFWVIAVQQMMQIHRDYYYLMYHWLASIGVAFGLEHLFIDPLLTLVFGDFSFYRLRGFFYDFRLGERYKEIEQ